MKKYIVKLPNNSIDLYYKRFIMSLTYLNNMDEYYIISRKDDWNEFEIYEEKIYCVVCELTEKEYNYLSKNYDISDYNVTQDQDIIIYSLNEVLNFEKMTKFKSNDGALYRIDSYGDLQKYFESISSNSGYWDYPKINKSLLNTTFTLINKNNK